MQKTCGPLTLLDTIRALPCPGNGKTVPVLKRARGLCRTEAGRAVVAQFTAYAAALTTDGTERAAHLASLKPEERCQDPWQSSFEAAVDAQGPLRFALSRELAYPPAYGAVATAERNTRLHAETDALALRVWSAATGAAQ